MTPTLYIVWRRTPNHCWRIWLPEHFKAESIPVPGPTATDVRYHGPDYDAALKACYAANGVWVNSLSDFERAVRPAPPSSPPSVSPCLRVEPSLFDGVPA